MTRSPRALVVTGMHRSGTSLLAGFAAHGGIDMGCELVAAGKGNRRGHFEDLELVRFHESALVARGAEALRPPPAAVERWSREEERTARALLARRTAKRLWGWKDPRTTLFLPLWDRLLPDAFYLLVYRHPVEVALSLLRRGLDLEVQLDPRVAIEAWTVHNRLLLAFRAGCPERCLLWPITAAASDPGGALAQLAGRSGLALDGAGLAGLYEPGQLHLGRRARGIEWGAILPGAIELHGRLEAAADLPASGAAAALDGAGTRFERELQEASEHLLAGVLGAAADRRAVSREERVEFSELRQQVERQQERLDQLGRELTRRAGRDGPGAVAGARGTGPNGQGGPREAGHRDEARREEGAGAGEQGGDLSALARHLEAQRGERARIEATRAWRLVNAYWRTARRVSGWKRQAGWQLGHLIGSQAPPRPEEVVVGCVAGPGSPHGLEGARRLVRSLRWFGGSLAGARVLVCASGAIPAGDRDALARDGAEVRIVE